MFFTLGHSNHSAEKFIGLLRQHPIELVVDVRSQPVSRFSPHFRKQNLEKLLAQHGMGYVWLEALGGRPKDPRLYDAQGRADYAAMAVTEPFRQGLETLKELAGERGVALLCSEEDPNRCHRRLLVVRALCEESPLYQNEVWHIRKDGTAWLEADLVRQEQTEQTRLR